MTRRLTCKCGRLGNCTDCCCVYRDHALTIPGRSTCRLCGHSTPHNPYPE